MNRLQLQQQALREANHRISSHAARQNAQRVGNLAAFGQRVGQQAEAAKPARPRVTAHEEIHDDEEKSAD